MVLLGPWPFPWINCNFCESISCWAPHPLFFFVLSSRLRINIPLGFDPPFFFFYYLFVLL